VSSHPFLANGGDILDGNGWDEALSREKTARDKLRAAKRERQKAAKEASERRRAHRKGAR
jgi:hypothetical protein